MFGAKFGVHGSHAIGTELMPLLIEGYASAYRGNGPPAWSRYRPGQLREALAGWEMLVYEEGVFPCDWADGRAVPLVRVLARKPAS